VYLTRSKVVGFAPWNKMTNSWQLRSLAFVFNKAAYYNAPLWSNKLTKLHKIIAEPWPRT